MAGAVGVAKIFVDEVESEPKDAVTLKQPWTLGLPAQDDQLLPESKVLGDEVGFLWRQEHGRRPK